MRAAWLLRRTFLIAVALSALAAANCGAPGPSASRPARQWAQAVSLEGVPNLHKVSDGLYRSGQPTEEGMERLKAFGIKTVVNLRTFHSDRDEIGKTGLAREHIYVKAWHPEEEDVVRFLRIAADPARAPVLVHCQHGADRTGAMCALYRVAVQGWSKEEAVKEMTEGGFGFHGVWENLIDWINAVDIEKLKKEAGLKDSAEQSAAPAPRDSPGGSSRSAGIRKTHLAFLRPSFLNKTIGSPSACPAGSSRAA